MDANSISPWTNLLFELLLGLKDTDHANKSFKQPGMIYHCFT